MKCPKCGYETSTGETVLRHTGAVGTYIAAGGAIVGAAVGIGALFATTGPVGGVIGTGAVATAAKKMTKKVANKGIKSGAKSIASWCYKCPNCGAELG